MPCMRVLRPHERKQRFCVYYCCHGIAAESRDPSPECGAALATRDLGLVTMKTGIIGLPQVGTTSLFKSLTKAPLSPQHVNPREAHVGVAKVPDDRLDRLAALYNPRKLMHASVEYVDVAAMPAHSSHAEAKAGAGLSDAIVANIRQVDA